MITYTMPPHRDVYVIQAYSAVNTAWVDLVAMKAGTPTMETEATESLGRRRLLDPERPMRLVRRVITETVLGV